MNSSTKDRFCEILAEKVGLGNELYIITKDFIKLMCNEKVNCAFLRCNYGQVELFLSSDKVNQTNRGCVFLISEQFNSQQTKTVKIFPFNRSLLKSSPPYDLKELLFYYPNLVYFINELEP